MAKKEHKKYETVEGHPVKEGEIYVTRDGDELKVAALAPTGSYPIRSTDDYASWTWNGLYFEDSVSGHDLMRPLDVSSAAPLPGPVSASEGIAAAVTENAPAEDEFFTSPVIEPPLRVGTHVPVPEIPEQEEVDEYEQEELEAVRDELAQMAFKILVAGINIQHVPADNLKTIADNTGLAAYAFADGMAKARKERA